MMRVEDLSTQLSIRNTVTGRSGGAYGARIDAVRRVFAGTLPIRDEELGCDGSLAAGAAEPAQSMGAGDHRPGIQRAPAGGDGLMKRIVLLLFVVLPVPSVDAARVQVSTGAPVDVLIAVGAPTVVTFPEKVTAIPTSADPEALSLEIEGERLFIQSLREGFGAVLFVVGQSGRLYLLNLVEHEPPDIEVQLVLPQEPPRFGDPPPAASRRPSRPQRRVGNPMRRLLVAMVKGEALPGVKVLAHDQPLAMSSELEIRTTHLYAAGRYLGFIGKASNLTDGPFVLRLPEYQARGLKAITAEDETIPAGGETRVFLVVEPGAPY